MNVKKEAFSDVMLHNVVYWYQHFRGTCCLHFQAFVHPEDEGSRFLPNVGTYLPTSSASHTSVP
jgi:hypothetical protein